MWPVTRLTAPCSSLRQPALTLPPSRAHYYSGCSVWREALPSWAQDWLHLSHCSFHVLYRRVREAGEAVRAQAAQLRREATPAENRRAQRETERLLQRLAEVVEGFEGA